MKEKEGQTKDKGKIEVKKVKKAKRGKNKEKTVHMEKSLSVTGGGIKYNLQREGEYFSGPIYIWTQGNGVWGESGER